MNPTLCPECGSENTEEINIDTSANDTVIIVRACRDCPTDYTVSYVTPVIEDVSNGPLMETL